MRHLDLFSGIGGFALAARNMGWETVAFCEIDPFCRQVLRKHWPDVPIYEDIRELNYGGPVDLVTGGFPCQPFSTAAHGLNNAEDLWPEMARIVEETRPTWVLAENVPGNEFKHIEQACFDLARCDYRVWPIDVAVEARNHIRRRIWILAHSNSDGEPDGPIDEEASVVSTLAGRGSRPDSCDLGVADGLSEGVDRRKRLRALGSAICPEVPEMIFRAIA